MSHMTERISKLVSKDKFIENTLNNLKNSIDDLRYIIANGSGNKTVEEKPICHYFNCPRLRELEDIVRESIETLEETKKSFRSKELGKLRKKLKKVLYQDI